MSHLSEKLIIFALGCRLQGVCVLALRGEEYRTGERLVHK